MWLYLKKKKNQFFILKIEKRHSKRRCTVNLECNVSYSRDLKYKMECYLEIPVPVVYAASSNSNSYHSLSHISTNAHGYNNMVPLAE